MNTAENELIPVVGPSGEKVRMSQDELAEQASFGYRPASPKEIVQETLRKKYGEGAGNEIMAGLLGGASGLTMGLSGLVAPETQALYKEFNPASWTTGEGIGIAAPIIATLGSAAPLEAAGQVGVRGALKTAARFTAPGLITSGARAVESGVGKALGEGLVSKIAARSLSGGIEGAIYNNISVPNEMALGDPNLNAQKIFSNIGMGFLFGGALSGGTAALGAGYKGGKSWLLGKFGRGTELPEAVVAAPGVAAETEVAAPRVRITPKEASTLATKIGGEATEADVLYANENAKRMATAPRLATNVDPAETGQTTMEQVLRDSYESLQPRIKTLADANREMLEHSGIEKAPTELSSVVDSSIESLENIRAPGEQTTKSIARLKSLKETIEAEERPFSAQDIKDTIGELDSDLEGFYAGKIGSKTTKQERVLLGVRHELADSLKSDMKAAGFPEYADNLGEMRKLISAQERMEKHFGNATAYQRAISELAKWEKGYKGGAPIVSRGSKSGIDWLKALDDLGELSGNDFRTMYKDRAVWARLNPDLAKGPEAIHSWLGEIFRTAKHPVRAGTEFVGGMLGVTEKPEIWQQYQRRAAQEALFSGIEKPAASAANRSSALISSMKKAIQGGSDLFQQNKGTLQGLMVPMSLQALKFLDTHHNMDEATHKMETLIALERARNQADRELKSGVGAIFAEGHEKPDWSTKLGDALEKKTPEDHAKELEKIAADVNELQNNPWLALERMGSQIEGIETAAPGVAVGLNITATRALDFLAGKLQLPEKKTLDPSYKPSKQELIQLGRFIRLINNPNLALKQVASGNFTSEAKSILEAVHPELYEHMKVLVMTRLAELQAKGKTVPRNRRLVLSHFLDQELDRTMTQPAIAKYQAAFMPMAPQPVPSAPRGSVASLGKSKAVTRIQTPLQRVANR